MYLRYHVTGFELEMLAVMDKYVSNKVKLVQLLSALDERITAVSGAHDMIVPAFENKLTRARIGKW